MQTTLTSEEPFEGRTSTELALGCFAIGTLFFILMLTLQDTSYVLIIGFIFTMMAVLLNAIMFCHLAYHYCILHRQRKYIGQKILILLSNIPIALVYFGIVMNVAAKIDIF